MKRLLASVAFLLFPVAAARGEDPGFIRVEEDAKVARLQTAITRYEKSGATVDLIGAVHIGDLTYYQALNKRFADYEVLLFEMIGGEGLNAAAKPDPADPQPPNPLHLIYDGAARKLKLTGQVDHIDYTAKNFLHADLTAAEFSQKQTERGESLFGFFLNNSESSGRPPNPLKFALGLMSNRADLLKLSIIHTLGEGDDQIAALAGESVIIGDRNVRCLEVLAEQLAAGRKSVGIFYGAAHFPDMEKRLLADGFIRKDQEWLTAWNVLKPIKKSASEP